ncbi:MAG: 30S ribosomal protein S4 [Thermoplasmata archaeon]|nr:30S ribosomal protein S4 [Thermoplasmata archaeon]
MGDPRFLRKRYESPSHPWQAERIAEEKEILFKFGLKNKRELWKAQSILRGFRAQARELQARARTGEGQAMREIKNLMEKLYSLGLLPKDADLNDVLGLTVEDILSRRLQSIVYSRGLAVTIKQARQLIVHGHIYLNGRRVTIPGYLVRRAEEDTIMYNPSSPFSNEEHPMRPEIVRAAASVPQAAKEGGEE